MKYTFLTHKLKAITTILIAAASSYSPFCSADDLSNPPSSEFEMCHQTYVDPHDVSITEEGIFVYVAEEQGYVQVDGLTHDTYGLITLHKHKIYCLKCLGCDPENHPKCKDRCKCKNPKLR